MFLISFIDFRGYILVMEVLFVRVDMRFLLLLVLILVLKKILGLLNVFFMLNLSWDLRVFVVFW